MKRTLIYAALTGMILAVLSGLVFGQTDPRTLPMLQPSDVVAEGRFQLPTAFQWDQHAMTVVGDLMTVGCNNGGVGVVRVPTSGVATIVTPCTDAAPSRVQPGVNSVGFAIGGLLAWQNTLIMSAYNTYNNGADEPYTHVTAANVAGLATGAAWKMGTMRSGMVNGPMGYVPTEWQPLLGGPVLSGNCCISIINRTSRGPSVGVMNPMNPTTAKWLVGYPEGHETLGTYEQNPTAPYYGAPDLMAGVFIPPGTRSLVTVGRHADNNCYGSGAACNDPLNPNQGTHGAPYHKRLTVYDLNTVLAATNPWDATPVAAWDLPGTNTTSLNATRGAFFDPTTRKLYVAEIDSTEVLVFRIGASTVPPPPPPPPPAGPTGTLTNVPATCTVTMTLDATTGSVQFQRRLAGTSGWTSHGTVDASAPYTRTATIPVGTYEGQAVWSGATTPIALGVQPCK